MLARPLAVVIAVLVPFSAGLRAAAADGAGNTTNWTVVAGPVCLVVSATNGAGIRGFSPRNRVEGNNRSANVSGINASDSNNIIIRNTCASNATDWIIAADNCTGPILDRRGVSSAAVNGFSSPTLLHTADPRATFS